ncbi:hypothetical protein COJ01_17325 [Priestia megaterium]|uniref:GIY-YIG nuclease family protein n=1 Tax=Priestia megaterium TaxID=1404 RepID=UPI000BF6578E|nr:GIY-YIG nuclease family protein [Priestia megaterium]PFK99832.1 hypothetical protein COJ01_17325 [Priestia megaterium]
MKKTNNKEINKERFIQKAKDKYGDKFDYSNFKYVNAKTKSIIICDEHGPFEQTPDKHLNGKIPCPVCTAIFKAAYRPKKNVERPPVSPEDYMDQVKEKYGDKFTIDLTNYEGLTKGTVTLTCPKHGPSDYVPRSILVSNCGCKFCGMERKNSSKTKPYEDFIEKSKIKHNDFYTYPETNSSIYINRKTVIDIICPTHGPFKKTAQKHLSGQGCFECKVEELIDTGILCGGYNDKLFEREPEIAQRDSLVYYMKIGSYYKIGITTNLGSRIRALRSSSKSVVEVLQTVKLPLIDSYKLESRILEEYKTFRVRTNWSTELFSKDILPDKLLSDL